MGSYSTFYPTSVAERWGHLLSSTHPRAHARPTKRGGSSATCYPNPMFEDSPRRKVVHVGGNGVPGHLVWCSTALCAGAKELEGEESGCYLANFGRRIYITLTLTLTTSEANHNLRVGGVILYLLPHGLHEGVWGHLLSSTPHVPPVKPTACRLGGQQKVRLLSIDDKLWRARQASEAC